MTLSDIQEAIGGAVVTDAFEGHKEVESGFVGDLLSVVMGKAKEGCVWVTIQSHINIVAVAALVDMACVIVTEGFQVDEDAVAKANGEGITIMTTGLSSFEVCRVLAGKGLL